MFIAEKDNLPFFDIKYFFQQLTAIENISSPPPGWVIVARYNTNNDSSHLISK